MKAAAPAPLPNPSRGDHQTFVRSSNFAPRKCTVPPKDDDSPTRSKPSSFSREHDEKKVSSKNQPPASKSAASVASVGCALGNQEHNTRVSIPSTDYLMKLGTNGREPNSLISCRTTEIPKEKKSSYNHSRLELSLFSSVLESKPVASSTSTAEQTTLDGAIIKSSLDTRSLRKDTAVSIGAILALDFMHIWVRFGLPRKWLFREMRRRYLRRNSSLMEPTGNLQISFQIPTSRHNGDWTKILTRKAVHGLKNYGQTCFLNSVLQALSGLPPFLLYLERAVQLNSELQENEPFGGRYKNRTKPCLNEFLLHTLLHLNGCAHGSVNPREILYRVGEKHKQFRPRQGRGIAHVGTEQQDAQELLQSLLGMIITDAHLDSSSSPESASISSFTLDKDTVASMPGRNAPDTSSFSLSSFLTKIDLKQQDSNTHVPFKDENSDTVDGHISEDLLTVFHREEKKHEDFEIEHDKKTAPSPPPPVLDAHLTSEYGTRKAGGGESTSMHLSTAMKNMLSTISTISPSPLSGWVGSTLQCCTCHHIRPIQNAPFLDIAIVPTSVSRYLSSPHSYQQPSSTLPACTLSQCLQDFTSVERVQGVDCQSCTIRSEMARLEEEICMLRGAIDTILSRSEKMGIANGGKEQVKAMEDELLVVQARHHQVKSMDSDDTEEWENMNLDTHDEFFLDGPQCKHIALERGSARKCLMLTRLPTVLSLHVQRRYYDPTKNCMTKAMQHIDFPEELDLRPHCAYGGNHPWTGKNSKHSSEQASSQKPILYRLMSIIEHRGNAHAGHYQTYRRAAPSAHLTKEWVLVSDLNVTPLHWTDVKKCQAYMLFYEIV